ncbi:MAG: class I tRNA ligase family protein, partial [Rhodospirillaceae bacterium]|nr:class I tRNA ligase family protein [Rhodospirillaceae bacterium]
VNKNCEGAVPRHGEFTEDDNAMLGAAHLLLDTVRGHIDAQAFNDALEAVWVVIRASNAYVDAQAPWKLKKEDPARMETVLYVLSETIRHIAIMLQPFMPDTIGRMLDQLAVSPEHRSFDFLGPEHALVPGTALVKPEGVFPRYVEEEEGA